MELFIYYILPNVLLFGSIYLFARAGADLVWYVISNHEKFRK